MPGDLPEKLNIVIATRRVDVETIKAVSPDRLNVIDAFADIYTELERDWPRTYVEQHIGPMARSGRSADEMEELIRQAHVMVFGMPYPMSLASRAENLLWAHFTNAAPVNLRMTPWWGGRVTMTTSRGHSNPLPIAETVLAAVLMFAKRLDLAALTTSRGLDMNPLPEMKLLKGKVLGIVGLGGIGSDLARLAKALGMRVVATRRSVQTRQLDAQGVDELLPATSLVEMLPACDFVALCAYLTPETEKLIDSSMIAAMKPGAYLINIARGPMIDEGALIEALQSGQLAGSYLDTWSDDLEMLPGPALLAAPNIVFTPHSARRADAAWTPGGVPLFCENLRHLLNGEPLENVIDSERGY